MPRNYAIQNFPEARRDSSSADAVVRGGVPLKDLENLADQENICDVSTPLAGYLAVGDFNYRRIQAILEGNVMSSVHSSKLELRRPKLPSTQRSAIRILIVQEEPVAQAQLRRIFAQWPGIEVFEASNGLEALEMIVGEEIDLVLLGLDLPQLAGIDLLELISCDPAFSHIQKVVVTRHNQAGAITRAINLGITDYILSPWSQIALESRLAELVEKASTAQKQEEAIVRANQVSQTRMLIGDQDRNFCEFVTTVLHAYYELQFAGSPGELLTSTLRWAPSHVLLNPTLVGLKRLPFFLRWLQKIRRDEQLPIYVLTDELTPERTVLPNTKGWVEKTFVPKKFLASIAKIAPAGLYHKDEVIDWFAEFEPEIVSAVRQVFGVMTETDVTWLKECQNTGPKISVVVLLANPDKPFRLMVLMEISRALAVTLTSRMTGIEAEQIDEELLQSGARELTNMVSGRIKHCCERYEIQLGIGLPVLLQGDLQPITEPLAVSHKHFQWEGESGCITVAACLYGPSCTMNNCRFQNDCNCAPM